MKKTHNVESAEVVEGQEDQQKVEDCIDVDPAGNLWIIFLTVLNLKEKNCKTHFLHFIQIVLYLVGTSNITDYMTSLLGDFSLSFFQ